MKILFTGGGTGGHIMPLLAIIRELRYLDPKGDLNLYYIGPKDKQNASLFNQEGVKTLAIITGKIRRYFAPQNIIDVGFKIPLSLVQSFFLLLFIRPKLVFSKGGSGSLMVCWVAKFLKIPVFIHESDSVPGLSNIEAYKFAAKIFTSFKNTIFFDPGKTTLVGNPIRKGVIEGGTKEDIKKYFKVTFERPLLLIMGGSQGAKPINDFLMVILEDVLRKFEIIHIAGSKTYHEAQLESQVILEKVFLDRNENLSKYYHVYRSLEEKRMKNAYMASDLIIARGGSGSIFEIAALGKPSIIIPLPSSASNHQLENAYQYSETGAALILEQNNLTPNFFLAELHRVFAEPHTLKRMSEAAKKFAKIDAGEKIAKEIFKFVEITQLEEANRKVRSQ